VHLRLNRHFLDFPQPAHSLWMCFSKIFAL